ncbi:hypothetical protein ACQY0O_005361 [Thecaphora frezii]
MQRLDSFSVQPLQPLPDSLPPSGVSLHRSRPIDAVLVSSTLLSAPSAAPVDAPRFRLPPLLHATADYDPVLDSFARRQHSSHLSHPRRRQPSPPPAPAELRSDGPLRPLHESPSRQRRRRSNTASSCASSSYCPSPPTSSSSRPSFWDDDEDATLSLDAASASARASNAYLHHWSAFRVSYRHAEAAPSPAPFITDHAFLDARGELRSADISEAVLEHLDPVPAERPGVVYRPAPKHPLADVVASLAATASTGLTSRLFHWDEATHTFDWAHTLARRAELHAERRNARRKKRAAAAKAAAAAKRASQASLTDDTDAAADAAFADAAAPTAEWWGAERIQGWTQPASDSVVRPFLEAGTLLRRIEARLAEVRNAGNTTKEAPALAFALETMLDWIKQQLACWAELRLQSEVAQAGRPAACSSHPAYPAYPAHPDFPTYRGSLSTDASPLRCSSPLAILNAASELEEALQVLRTLANLLSCAASRAPPLKPLAWLVSTSGCLSHLHSHLVAAVASRASPLSQALLAFLLDRTSRTWRTEVATWIGWPGFHSDRTGEMDQDAVAQSTRATPRSHGKWKEAKRAVPWSGAEIEWALDERGEEDVGYTLRPSAVPSFVGLGDARDFLEAGRALRLLKRAAPSGHPLVAAWTLEVGGIGAGHGLPPHHQPSSTASEAATAPLPLPTWVWQQAESDQLSAATQARVAKLRGEVARWRRRRMRSQRFTSFSGAASADVTLASSLDNDFRGFPRSASSPLLLGRLDAIEASTVGADDVSHRQAVEVVVEAEALGTMGKVGLGLGLGFGLGLGPVPSGSALDGPSAASRDSLEDRFARMTRLFDAVPPAATLLASPAAHTGPGCTDADAVTSSSPRSEPPSPTPTPQEALVLYLADYLISTSASAGYAAAMAGSDADVAAHRHSACTSSSSVLTPLALAQLTRASLIAPLQTWSRLINSALIRVFFQDLGLATYLETCKRFLLLGSDHFESRISAALFGAEDDANDGYGYRNDGGAGAGAVALSRRLTAEGKWPPTDALLSSSLNSAVLETVSGMRAANSERIRRTTGGGGSSPSSPVAMAGSGARGARCDEDAAVSLALKDLDDRLSFAVIDPATSSSMSSLSSSSSSSSLTSNWTDPHSIAALDWLTLSFHPPPLIAPLLTQLAQMRYQRLWNLLLRFKRVRMALRLCFQQLFGKASDKKAPGKKAATSRDAGDEETRVARQFHWRARQFLDAVEGYVHEIGIELHWTRFMGKLEGVRRSVADEGGGGEGGMVEKDEADADTPHPGDGDGDGGEEGDEAAEEGEEEGYATTLELKDVFSLSRFHERVLDRMLEACFLKQRQRRLLGVLSEVLQVQLEFCGLVVGPSTPASASNSLTSSKKGRTEKLEALQKFHDARIGMFIKALVLVRQRGAGSRTKSDWKTRGEANEEEGEGRKPKSRRKLEVEEEVERQQREWKWDMEALDSVKGSVRGGGAMGVGVGKGRGMGAGLRPSVGEGEKLDNIDVLLARLDGGGFYRSQGLGGY